MSQTNKPFGLTPIYHPSGVIKPTVVRDGILSGYAFNLLKGQFVKLNTNGTIEKAAVGDPGVGTFHGVQWTDTTGRTRVSNYWPANTVYQVGSCQVFFYADPDIIYEGQADGPVLQTAIGDQVDISNPDAGSAITGLSQATLSTVLAGVGVQKTFIVLGQGLGVDNNWGDPFTVLRVKINESQFQAPVNAI